MWLMPSLNWNSKMNKLELLAILEDLKATVERLETAIKADPSKYQYESSPNLNVKYEDVLEYYQTNDDDGDGLWV